MTPLPKSSVYAAAVVFIWQRIALAPLHITPCLAGLPGDPVGAPVAAPEQDPGSRNRRSRSGNGPGEVLRAHGCGTAVTEWEVYRFRSLLVDFQSLLESFLYFLGDFACVF